MQKIDVDPRRFYILDHENCVVYIESDEYTDLGTNHFVVKVIEEDGVKQEKITWPMEGLSVFDFPLKALRMPAFARINHGILLDIQLHIISQHDKLNVQYPF